MSGFPDIPPIFDGVRSPSKFLETYNTAWSHADDHQVHMDTEFAQLFWNVAYRDGYEWGAKDTTAAVTAKHTEMSAELSVLRDNQTDRATLLEKIAKAEDELRKAAEGLKAQRDQIIDMERARRAMLEEMDELSAVNALMKSRSPIYLGTLAAENITQRIRRRMFGGR